MQNSEYFIVELSWVKNPETRALTAKLLDLAPPYFAEKPSSSTGKYHSGWSNQVGGLRMHTRGVAYVAKELAPAYSLSDAETDGAIIASLAHDLIKYGFAGGQWTTKTHEHEGATFFKKAVEKLGVTLPCYKEIYEAIDWHQGSWCTTPNSPPFPEGFSKLAQVVHVADMVASRKEIRFNFLENNLIG